MSHDRNGELPQGWAWAQLGEVGRWSGGGTPSKSNPAFWKDGTIPWISPKDMKQDFLSGAEDTITEAALEGSAAKLIPAGSVLFVTRSGILRHTLPVGVTKVDAAVNQDLKALTPNAAVDARYLLRFAQAFNRELLDKCSKDGTTVQSIETEALRSFPVPLSPLPEQHRIVDKIDELFSDLDAGEAALEKTERLLQRYRQSFLKAAVEGELTREWRKQNPAGESADLLLERILEERRARWEADQLAKYEAKGKKRPAGWKNRYKLPAGVDAEKLPELPEGWRWVALDQVLATGLTNGRSVRSREGGFPVLRLTAIRDGIIDLAESKSGAWTATEAAQYHVRDGDFLIARGNGSLDLVGRGGLVRRVTENVAYPDTMIRARVLETGFLPEMLRSIWDSGWVRAQITSAARTTAGIYKVNQRHLENTILPLLPLAEQEAIVEEVERLLSVVDAVAEEVTRQRGRAKQLRRAILQHAFEGRLVPQDPEDEPAEALLERIRAEKNGQPKSSKKQGRKSGWKAKEGVEEVRVRLD